MPSTEASVALAADVRRQRRAWSAGALAGTIVSQYFAFTQAQATQPLIVFCGLVAIGLLLHVLLVPRTASLSAATWVALLGPVIAALDSAEGSVLAFGVIGVLVFATSELAAIAARVEAIGDPSIEVVQGRLQDGATIAAMALGGVVMLAALSGLAVPGGVVVVLIAAAVVAAMVTRLR